MSTGMVGPLRLASDFSLHPSLANEFLARLRLLFASSRDHSPVPSSSLARSHAVDVNVPELVHGRYHSLLALPSTVEKTRTQARASCLVYKAIDAETGEARLLRRLRGTRNVMEMAMYGVLEYWKHVRHPNIVGMTDAFLSTDFGDCAPGFVDMFLVFEFFPFARSIEEMVHERLPPGVAANKTDNAEVLSSQAQPVLYRPPEEPLLWSMLCQLVSAVRFIHLSGGSVRLLDASKVIASISLFLPARFRIAGTGLADIVRPLSAHGQHHHHGTRQGSKNVSSSSTQDAQREDVIALGLCVLSFASGDLSLSGTAEASTSPQMQGARVNQAMDMLRQVYSQPLCEVVYRLSRGLVPTVFDACSLLGDRVFSEMDNLSCGNDFLEHQLQTEMENGRLFRVATKLATVTDREPADGTIPGSEETGDTYLAKLFRNYVFHQTDESLSGRPVVDLGHVVECLNKLDCGSSEPVCMMSADGRNMLVATFADIRKSVESAFAQLLAKSGQ